MPLLDTRKGKDLTGTLISDIVLQLLSYVAQTEREFIRRRQREGIAAARANGVHLGRIAKDRPENYEEVKKEWMKVLWITLIFLAISMILSVVSSLSTICNGGYRVISVINAIVNIIKVCTYALFGLFAFFGIKLKVFEEEKKEAVEAKQQNNEKIEVEIEEPNKDKE